MHSEPHYYSHLWAKHLEVAALRECNGGMNKSATGGMEKQVGTEV